MSKLFVHQKLKLTKQLAKQLSDYLKKVSDQRPTSLLSGELLAFLDEKTDVIVEY